MGEVDLYLQVTCGIRHSAKMTGSPRYKAHRDRELTPDDFSMQPLEFYTISSTTSSGSMMQMEDYAPLVFFRIRQMYGIESESYIKSWDVPVNKLKVSLGAGRSGSLFQLSNDRRYIFKTIPFDEVQSFMELLPHYYKHLVENPNCLITRVYGLHKFENKASHFDRYLVVFSNIQNMSMFPPTYSKPIVYDLKGRTPKRPNQYPNRGKSDYTFKDKDLERKFSFPNDTLQQLYQQIDSDLAFLRGNNLMDYSFLICTTTSNQPATTYPNQYPSRSLFERFYGGVAAKVDGSEVYLIGFIDFLTRYSPKKKVAHFFKSFRWEVNTLSTINSDDYHDRIRAYLRSILIPDQSNTLLTL